MISDGENVMNSSINIQKKIPFRTCIASFGLTLLGFTFFGLSIYFYINHDKHEGFAPLLIISIIALVPSIYSLYILFGTFCKWKGYSIDSLPSYEIL